MSDQASQKLLEVAEQKDDQPILLQTRDEDLISIELKYHNTCYGSYTPNVKAPLDMMATKQPSHIVGVVDEKVFDDMAIVKMTELLDTYFDQLEETDMDAQNYRTKGFKARLRSRSTTVTDCHIGSHTTKRKRISFSQRMYLLARQLKLLQLQLK